MFAPLSILFLPFRLSTSQKNIRASSNHHRPRYVLFSYLIKSLFINHYNAISQAIFYFFSPGQTNLLNE